MKRLTMAEMSNLAELGPNAWEAIAKSFSISPEKLRAELERGAVWIVSDKVLETLTGASQN